MNSIFVEYKNLPQEVSDALKTLRVGLEASVRDSGAKMIGVVGRDAEETGAESAFLLAASMAQAGKKTLLLDCNLRSEAMYCLLGLPRTVGFLKYLSQEGDLQKNICATPAENLFFLGAGNRVSDPAELLSSAPFRSMLQVLREQYDIVVVNTAPLISFSDALLTAALADCTVLSVRAGRVGKRQFRQMVQRLETAGAELAGVIINHAKPSKKRKKR